MATLYHPVWIGAPIAQVHGALSNAHGVSRWWDEAGEFLGFCNFGWGGALAGLKRVCKANTDP